MSMDIGYVTNQKLKFDEFQQILLLLLMIFSDFDIRIKLLEQYSI